MKKIHVDTEALLQCGVMLGSCAGDAADLSGEISSILSSLPECCEDKYAAKIRSYMREVKSISNDLKKLRKGVNKAVNIFSECEESNKNSFSLGKGEEAFSQSGGGEEGNIWKSWPLSWIDDFLDSLGIGKYSRDYEDPGSERQKAHDELIVSQINDLLTQEKYSSKNWSKATLEEKKQILNDLKNELNRIYGTNITKEIDFFTKKSENGLITYGSYRDSERLVRINTECLDDYKIVSTIVHEMRHAYQHEAVRNPSDFEVSEDTVKSWEDNFKNYKDSKTYGFDAYRDQPVEKDARYIQESVTYN